MALKMYLKALDVHPSLDATIGVHFSNTAKNTIDLFGDTFDNAFENRSDVIGTASAFGRNLFHLRFDQNDILNDFLVNKILGFSMYLWRFSRLNSTLT